MSLNSLFHDLFTIMIFLPLAHVALGKSFLAIRVVLDHLDRCGGGRRLVRTFLPPQCAYSQRILAPNRRSGRCRIRIVSGQRPLGKSL